MLVFKFSGFPFWLKLNVIIIGRDLEQIVYSFFSIIWPNEGKSYSLRIFNWY
jgi:hypothetical protein